MDSDNKEELKSYKGLFYDKTPILLENEIIDLLEFRFYKTKTPDEKYRIGQKSISGRVIQIEMDSYNATIKIRIDTSSKYCKKEEILTIDDKYLEQTKTKLIVISNKDKTIEIPISVNDYRIFDANVKTAYTLLYNNKHYFIDDIVKVIKKSTGTNTEIETVIGRISTISASKFTLDMSDTYFGNTTAFSLNLESYYIEISPEE